MKIQLQTFNDVSDCPFYIKHNSEKLCFMKFNITAPIASHFVENPNFDFSTWSNDCNGQFENCAFIKLLYRSEDVDSNVDNQLYEDFNPFEEEIQEPPSQDKQKIHEPINEDDLVFVKVVGVDNVYSVKVDALIYANNQMLIIDDEELNYRSFDKIQEELNKIAPPAPMGSVFKTTNGGDHKGGIVPKSIYHAIVATQTRLVNEGAITKSSIKALSQADEDGCKSVAILPMDCGNFDLHQTANSQLMAIYNFLETVPTKNIKNIFIITTKSDKVTLDIFNEKFDRIFGE
jgi:O-acetyl-ADP-ribose deacetylase (regulator of RNase III)